MKVWSARLAILLGTLALIGNIAGPARAEPILSTPAPGGAAADRQPPEISDAIAKFKGMDFDGALKALKEAVAKNRDLSPAQVIMANLYAQVNRPTDARLALERAVMEEPADPEAYVVLRQVAIQDRRVTEADLLLTYAKSLLDQFEKSPLRKKALLTATDSGLAAVAEARGDWAYREEVSGRLAVPGQEQCGRPPAAGRGTVPAKGIRQGAGRIESCQRSRSEGVDAAGHVGAAV